MEWISGGSKTEVFPSAPDPKLLFSDPDPESTRRVITDLDPTLHSFGIQIIQFFYKIEILRSKMVSSLLNFSPKSPDLPE